MFGLFGASSSSNESDQQQPNHRPTTRSQSRGNAANLELPPPAVAAFNGIARGRRTPSPRAVGHNANSSVVFLYDTTNVSQQLLQQQPQQRSVSEFDNADGEDKDTTSTAMATAQTIDELRASAAAAVEAANAATAALAAAASLITQQSAQPAQQIRTRKPELPEFDRKNVEIWVRRVQSAYDRAGICTPKDKFAFLESKFAVGANPSIDAYLYGPATEDAWEQFISYLINEYGRTVRQEAQFIRGQFSRDGRKPSQMLAHIKDKVRRVTIDDILKEIVISSLPTDVQQMVAERAKDLSADQAASIADNYFDQEGRPLHSRAPTVHHIDPPSIEEQQQEDNNLTEINAVRGRRGGFRGSSRGGHNNNNNHSSRSYNNSHSAYNNASWPPNRMGVKNRSHVNGRGGQHRTPPSASSTSSSASAAANAPKSVVLCRNHQRFGDQAYNCHDGCSRWPEMPKRDQGNANAGNRM